MTPPIQLTAIYHTARGAGARFEDVAGWRLPYTFGDLEGEREAARHAAALLDEGARGRVLIEGKRAGAFLGQVLAAPALETGRGAAVEQGVLFRLRDDLFLLHSEPEAAALAALRAAAAGADDLVTVTDRQQGWAELLLVGPAGAAILGRVCGLDFEGERFPDLTARFSSVARTRQLILRRDRGDLQAYSLLGARSLAAYLWDTIREAGDELGLRAAGRGALADISPS